VNIPLRGFGTYKLRGEECRAAVKMAIEVGYRHVDTALAYENHQEVGEAIRGFPRDQLFLTSKVWPDELQEDRLLAACDRALQELQTSYLDLWLIHWPSEEVPIAESLSAMAQLQKQGKVLSIGVSNFTIPLLEEAMGTGIPFSVNQIEVHPYRQQQEVVAFCTACGIHVTAYSPLARGRCLEEGALQLIGKRHGKSPSQVILRWLEQRGISAIPKASSEAHIRSNFSIDDFTLDEEELHLITTLDGTPRLVTN
jgi:diketogulonate reductase-like aldo/keto reductase